MQSSDTKAESSDMTFQQRAHTKTRAILRFWSQETKSADTQQIQSAVKRLGKGIVREQRMKNAHTHTHIRVCEPISISLKHPVLHCVFFFVLFLLSIKVKYVFVSLCSLS